MLEFIGKFHPLLVHMPIGIFVFAVIFKIYISYKKWEITEAIIGLLLMVTFWFSIFSIISGLILSSKGDYDLEMVDYHRNMGILFSLNLLIIYFFRNHKWVNVLWFSGVILLIITGHQGGNLTHGQGFLSIENNKSEPIAIENIQEAQIYDQVIKPILEEKCVQCHSSKKQKGKLRLDSKEYILKGGETGNCITPNQSVLVKRLFLEENDEEHMPPKVKPQLSQAQKEILEWWINSGADFNKIVKEISQNDDVKKSLLTLQQKPKTKDKEEKLPNINVSQPNINSLQFLRKSGIVILPIEPNSPLLSISILEKNLNQEQINALNKIRQNIVSLNLRGYKETQLLAQLSNYTNLIHLNLSNSGITDNHISKWNGFKYLQSLNLTGTAVTSKGIESLRSISSLKSLYLFNSKFDTKHFEKIKANFPNTYIDTGAYKINESDSLRFVIDKI